MLPALTIVVIRTLLAAAAGWILWKVWRHFARRDAAVGRIVGAGLILRAFGAQLLFWLSYFHLPVARTLQDGDGFWKFAIDSRLYFAHSQFLLEKGWYAVVAVDRSLPSPVFLQSLAVFLFLFGVVETVGALLNLLAYCACCEAVMRIGGLEGVSRRPTLIALAALSFSPSLLLWSTQPLKDALFISAIAVFVAACARWRKGWLTGIGWRPLVAALSLLLVTLYAIVGIRWYFGVLMCLVSFPFLIMTIMASRRRVVSAIVNAVVFLLMLQVVAYTAGPYLPQPVARLLMGSVAPRKTARDLVSMVEKSRAGFDSTGGRSQIRAGQVLARAEAAEEPAVEAAGSRRQPRQAQDVPRSAIGRIVAGTAAVILPRFVSESLGIIHVGGGVGLWPLVDADTLFFDMLLLFVIVHVVTAGASGALRDPSFWLVALMTAGIAVLLTYTISNFGTLFRHRSMILTGLALLLAVTRAAVPPSTTPEMSS
jgi:hypothetical protein